jgi:hypothetical protein
MSHTLKHYTVQTVPQAGQWRPVKVFCKPVEVENKKPAVKSCLQRWKNLHVPFYTHCTTSHLPVYPQHGQQELTFLG